jgi:NAD-dependent deacetylase
LNFGDFDSNQNQLRPHIVWFGEEVPALEEAVSMLKLPIILPLSAPLQVYPAAGLIDFTNAKHLFTILIQSL